MLEKPSRIADARYCVNRTVSEAGQYRTDLGIAQIDRGFAPQSHQIFAAARRAIADHEIDFA